MLLTWKNLPLFEVTWESFDTIRAQFPAFSLEDNVRDIGGVMLGTSESLMLEGLSQIMKGKVVFCIARGPLVFCLL